MASWKPLPCIILPRSQASYQRLSFAVYLYYGPSARFVLQATNLEACMGTRLGDLNLVQEIPLSRKLSKQPLLQSRLVSVRSNCMS